MAGGGQNGGRVAIHSRRVHSYDAVHFTELCILE